MPTCFVPPVAVIAATLRSAVFTDLGADGVKARREENRASPSGRRRLSMALSGL
jgi:hypothetical protein